MERTSIDYTPMWRELGLDLEAHEKLAGALPKSYREVYLTQDGRPEGMRYFDYMLHELHGRRVKELIEYRRTSGMVVGMFCPCVPEEIVLALGGIPISLCAGNDYSEGGEEVESVIDAGACPLARSLAALRVSQACPHIQTTDIVIGETTCDTRVPVYELLSESRDVHLIRVPKTDRPDWPAAWRAEVDVLVDRLESVSGRKLTLENLREGVRRTNAKRRALRRFNSMRRAPETPVSGRDALLVAQFALYDDPERFTRMVEAVADELEARVALRLGINRAKQPRVIVAGSPTPVPNWRIHYIIESAGAVVVAEETCVGSRYCDRIVDEHAATLEDLLDDVALKHGDADCACASTTAGQRVPRIVEMARDYGADAIIHHTLTGCDCYHAEARALKDSADETGIPVLAIETGYSPKDSAQLMAAVGHFVSTLQ
jgi:benzoyl-CoA reductase/2-hydroxyglutaryl-CoA dehydratase subunit BcrC/BadD/HgdB